ncbi:Uncharacterized protein BM_BM13476 [Brugia malayi]|uniref:Bm13476 n=1 Tax=Brugia malayi TaxID=6279 RepID=A0A0K0IXY2_BRUMA|nr:Uncharacterized protein BM_BM13476 [Brugia malayi]CDP96572.1 Bm13476 [Brugia malayi]VIO98163.1 Uncharacterized protein BM_BM13476 [Brugia malayi]
MSDEKMELSAAFVHNFSSDFTYFFSCNTGEYYFQKR